MSDASGDDPMRGPDGDADAASTMMMLAIRTHLEARDEAAFQLPRMRAGRPAATSAPLVRSVDLDGLRARIDAGTYVPGSDAVARAMLRRLFGDQG